ncbi:MAG: MCE family protein [Gordonia sp. (in: high G+C Gram-positive bacteria)]|uniref:MCE family protein n=1 Tax=Gordonia sp. (in: high G+C Gram-positive bacteria) TaxID=84139 RepID=UPI0039E2E121
MTTPDQTKDSRFFSKKNLLWMVLAAIVALLLWAVGSWAFNLITATKVNATFPSAVGVYKGSNVKILGVNVGKVTKVKPNGQNVDVEMRVDHGVKLPADVGAVQMIPSLVADRFIQLTPAYNGQGPTVSGKVDIPRERTNVPVEIDQIYGNLQKLSKSLGPKGANKNGALSDAVKVAADNLDGNGSKLGEAITNLSDAANTLSNSRGNIADTVDNLNVFVGALKEHDAQVRGFNQQMADFTTYLAGEKDQLGAALDSLSYALGDVATFLHDNNQKLGDAIRDLQPTGQALLDNKDHLLEVFTTLPLAVSNLINAYDAESGTVAMRLQIPQMQDLIGAQCKLLDLGAILPGNPLAKQFSNTMRPLVDNCQAVGDQITQGVLEPMLPILPFGIMSNNKLQKMPTPGAVPGNPDPRLPGGN